MALVSEVGRGEFIPGDAAPPPDGPPVDTAGPEAMGSTGDGPGEMAVVAITLPPVADTFARDVPATMNYGFVDPLEVKSGVAMYTREAFLRFDLGSVATVGSAKLVFEAELFATMQTDISVPLGVHPVVDVTWNETQLNWSNKPAMGARLAMVAVKGNAFTRHELEVTAYVRQQKQAGQAMVSLGLRAAMSSEYLIRVHSREAAAGAMGPRLVITP
jgi:hypothetical protein